MSAWSILLRMLLCLGLLLNGSGYAAASATMPMEHPPAPAGDAAPAAGATAKADVPCHQHKRSGVEPAAATGDAPPPESSSPVAGSPDDGSPAGVPDEACDCCKSGLCRGTCMHQGQPAVAASPRYEPVPARNCDARPAKRGYASPALPDLIRPPIA